MIKRPNTNAQRQKRHKRVRAKVFGTTQRPRLNVFRSEKNIYAQIIDDVAGNAPRPRASTPWCSIAAAICTTAVWPSWLKAPARAAWNSERGGTLTNGKI